MEMLQTVVGAFAGAFFAFCFFVLGDLRKKREALLLELDDTREYLATLLVSTELNIQTASDLLESDPEPLGIELREFSFLPLREGVFKNIGIRYLSLSFVKFSVSIRFANENIRRLNRFSEELSSFARVAMLESKGDQFTDSIREQAEIYKQNIESLKKTLSNTKAEEMPRLIAEVDFLEDYIKTFFWRRWYMQIRGRMSPEYYEEQISNRLPGIK